jgi:hypothetical protein
MPSQWNKGTPVDQERKQVEETLTNIENFRQWAASNPPVKALPDGTLMRQATEDEWIAKATADNASDRKMDTDSVMSGWVINDTGTHVMQKIGKPTPYKLPDLPSDNGEDKVETSVDSTSEPNTEFLKKYKQVGTIASRQESTDEADDEQDDTFPFSDRTFDTFSETIKQLESSGRYDIAGGANDAYDGAYQLGRMAKVDAGKRLGIELKHDAESREAFRNDPQLQEAAFQAFTEANHETLMRLSGRYRGLSRAKKAEALAVAHLLGSGGAMEYLKGIDGTDAFNTSGQQYADAVRKALA